MISLSFTHLIFICIVIIGALWLSYYNIEKLHKEYIKLDQTFKQQHVRLEHMESLCSSISSSLLEKAQQEETQTKEETQTNYTHVDDTEDSDIACNMERFIEDNNADILKSLVESNHPPHNIDEDEDGCTVDEKFIENIIDSYEKDYSNVVIDDNETANEVQDDNEVITKDDDIVEEQSTKDKKKSKKKSSKKKNEPVSEEQKPVIEDVVEQVGEQVKESVDETVDETVDELVDEDEDEDDVSLSNMMVSELRQKLAAKNASTKGTKLDLIERLTKIRTIEKQST